MDANVITTIGGILGLGGIAAAIWKVMQLNTAIKDKGREEQKVLDQLKHLTEAVDIIQGDVALMRNSFSEMKDANQKEHHDLATLINNNQHQNDIRLQKLELVGCKPAKVTSND